MIVATVLLLTFAQFNAVLLQVNGLKLNPLLLSFRHESPRKVQGRSF
jgi:hypothetical protein